MSALVAAMLAVAAAVLSGTGGSLINGWVARRTAAKDARNTASSMELEGRRDAEKMRSEAYNEAYSVARKTIEGLVADVGRLQHDLGVEQRCRGVLEDVLRRAGVPVPLFDAEGNPLP